MKNCLFTAQFSTDCVDRVINSLIAEAVQLHHIDILMTAGRGATCLMNNDPACAESESAVASADRPFDILASRLAGTQAATSIEEGGIVTTGSIFAGFDERGISEVAELAEALVGLGVAEPAAGRYAREVMEKDAILIGVEVPEPDRDHIRRTITASTRAPRGSRLLC